MDFSQVKAITIPEGAVKQITDGLGRVLWKVQSAPSLTLSWHNDSDSTYFPEGRKITTTSNASGTTLSRGYVGMQLNECNKLIRVRYNTNAVSSWLYRHQLVNGVDTSKNLLDVDKGYHGTLGYVRTYYTSSGTANTTTWGAIQRGTRFIRPTFTGGVYNKTLMFDITSHRSGRDTFNATCDLLIDLVDTPKIGNKLIGIGDTVHDIVSVSDKNEGLLAWDTALKHVNQVYYPAEKMADMGFVTGDVIYGFTMPLYFGDNASQSATYQSLGDVYAWNYSGAVPSTILTPTTTHTARSVDSAAISRKWDGHTAYGYASWVTYSFVEPLVYEGGALILQSVPVNGTDYKYWYYTPYFPKLDTSYNGTLISKYGTSVTAMTYIPEIQFNPASLILEL